jgi:hypothetical protein
VSSGTILPVESILVNTKAIGTLDVILGDPENDHPKLTLSQASEHMQRPDPSSDQHVNRMLHAHLLRR